MDSVCQDLTFSRLRNEEKPLAGHRGQAHAGVHVPPAALQAASAYLAAMRRSKEEREQLLGIKGSWPDSALLFANSPGAPGKQK